MRATRPRGEGSPPRQDQDTPRGGRGGPEGPWRGRHAEDAARTILGALGYQVVETNFACRGGEIDVVCRHGDAWVFVEVRARAPSGFGTAAESVTATKRRRLLKAAMVYMARYGIADVDWRIALLALALDGAGRVTAKELYPSIVEDVRGAP